MTTRRQSQAKMGRPASDHREHGGEGREGERLGSDVGNIVGGRNRQDLHRLKFDDLLTHKMVGDVDVFLFCMMYRIVAPFLSGAIVFEYLRRRSLVDISAK